MAAVADAPKKEEFRKTNARNAAISTKKNWLYFGATAQSMRPQFCTKHGPGKSEKHLISSWLTETDRST